METEFKKLRLELMKQNISRLERLVKSKEKRELSRFSRYGGYALARIKPAPWYLPNRIYSFLVSKIISFVK